MILVAGLDRDFRRFVRITLEREGYAVREAADGTGLSAPHLPDAIVWDCDEQTPFAGGAAGVPVIWVSTGLPGERPRGPNVLIKPFDPGELVALLANVLHEPSE